MYGRCASRVHEEGSYLCLSMFLCKNEPAKGLAVPVESPKRLLLIVYNCAAQPIVRLKRTPDQIITVWISSSSSSSSEKF